MQHPEPTDVSGPVGPSCLGAYESGLPTLGDITEMPMGDTRVHLYWNVEYPEATRPKEVQEWGGASPTELLPPDGLLRGALSPGVRPSLSSFLLPPFLPPLLPPPPPHPPRAEARGPARYGRKN